MRSTLRLPLAVIVALTVPIDPTAAEGPARKCSNHIRPAGTKNAYRYLGDRCEGEFQQEVGSTLFLVSLTLGATPRPTDESKHLLLTWLDPESSPLELTARVLEQHTYYRMDTEPASGTTTFDWSLSSLQAAGYQTKRLALTAVLRAQGIEGSARRYTPIAARYNAISASNLGDSFYSAVFVCGDEVLGIRATITDVVEGRRTPVWTNQLVVRDKFPATYPITLRIPRSKLGKGHYVVDVTADTVTDAAPARFEMLHD